MTEKNFRVKKGLSVEGGARIDSDLTVKGTTTGTFSGNLTGNVTGNVTGDVTGQVSDISNHSTTDLSEGNNLYYTTARADSDFDARLAGKSTSDVAEGTNLYYTTARADSDAKAAISVTDAGGDGSLSYNAGTITYTGPSASEARAHFAAVDAGGDGSFAYDSSTGQFTYTGPSATDVRAHFSAGTGVSINSGQVSIGQDVSTTSDVTFGKITADSAKLDIIDFNFKIGSPANLKAGVLYLDSDEQKGLSFVPRTRENDTPGVILNIGQETHLYVHNLSGAQIDNGQAVYISGTAHGEHPQVSLAKADTSATGMPVGLATMDIPNGAHGWVTTYGVVRDVNTAGMIAGNLAYLSADSAGQWSTTDVSVDDGYPFHVGTILRVDSSDGMILVDGNSEHFEYLRVQDRIKVSGKIEADSAVSNEVATGLIDLTPTDPGPAHKEGRIYYNDEYKALTVYNDVDSSSLQLGFEEWVRVYNNSGSTIVNGTPCKPTGAFGESQTVAPADATSVSNARVLGVATHNIPNNTYGYLTVRGLASGIDTSGLSAGGPVWLAPDGSLTSTTPTYPYFPTQIGGCIIADSSNGYLYVSPSYYTQTQSRTSGNSHIDGNLTIDGDLTVNGTQSVVSQANLSVDNSFIYLNSGDTIGSANTNFTGSGLNDAYFTGHYEGTTTQTFYVRIDGVGTGTGGVDTFEWSLDNFSTTEATGVDITGDDQVLADNISIFFNATTGHTSGDKWDGQASPVNVDTGWFTNRNTGATGIGYTHLGIYYDVSDNIFKVVDEYGPEPTGNIDDTDSTYSLGIFKADTFQGNLAGNVTGTVTGNASSATVLATSRNFSISGDITASGVAFNGSGNVTLSASITAGSIVNADINASAAIADTKLATISTAGKVQNSATTATSANTASAIVARDASGNFSAGTITATSFVGDGSNLTGLPASYTDADVDSHLSGGTGITYSSGVISHSDTSSQASVNNSNGIVVQDITLDGFGHITSIGTADLDNRYYTKTQSDSDYVNITGDTITGNLTFTNAAKARFASSFGNLELYNNGSNSYLWHNATSGNMFIRNAASLQDIVVQGKTSTVNEADFFRADASTGAAILYHNDVAKLETSATGVSVTGTVTATAFSGDGSGLTGLPAGYTDADVDSHLSGGTGITYSNGAISTDDAEIVHDNLSGFVANEHIDHSTVSITAGSGLTGGGTIASSRTLNVGAGSYITVAADTVSVDATSANTASKVVARDGSGNFSAGTITAALSGNASTASKWATARTITLGGDLTGNVSIDGSQNVTLTATVSDGAGSGLDADLLDGQHGSYYRINVYDNTGTLLN